MNHQLKIELSSSDGAMLRTLGLVERRGYRVQSCTLHAAVQDQQADDRRRLDLMVESDRPGDLLKRQLERLHDVLAVELQVPATRAVRRVSIHAPA